MFPILDGRSVGILIGVLVVDDHLVVRKGVRALLLDANDITVVGEAADGQEAVAEARRLRPQVILMDLKLPASTAWRRSARSSLSGRRWGSSC